MQQSYLPLYHGLMDELFQVLQSASKEADKMNECVQMSIRYWEELKLMAAGSGFKSEAEEIRFFRQEKPRFTGMIEYWLLRWQAVLFLPKGEEDRVDFWRSELRRVDKFHAENGAFWGYYPSGDSVQDKIWFMRASRVTVVPDKSRLYNQDPNTSCPNDWTLAMVVACGLYHAYVQERLHYYPAT